MNQKERNKRARKARKHTGSAAHAPKQDAKKLETWWRRERAVEDGKDPFCTCR